MPDAPAYPPAHGLFRRGLGLVSLYRRARAISAECYHCNEVDSWLVGVALKISGRPRLVFDVHETFPGHDRAGRPVDSGSQSMLGPSRPCVRSSARRKTTDLL